MGEGGRRAGAMGKRRVRSFPHGVAAGAGLPGPGWALLLVLLGGCSSPAAAPARSGNDPSRDPAVRAQALLQTPRSQELRAAVTAAATPDEKAAAYKSFFTEVGRTSLPELEKDPDVGIALQASWEDHRIARTGAGSSTLSTANPEEMGRFLESVRARTGLEPPDSWKEALLGAHVATSFGEHSTLGWGSAGSLSRTTLATPEGTVGASPTPAGGYPFDLSLGEKWRSRVWATGRSGAFTGWGPHEVKLLGGGGRVTVFGWESHGAYIEAFDLASGSPAFRFSSCYWFHWSEEWTFPDDRPSKPPPDPATPQGRKHRNRAP